MNRPDPQNELDERTQRDPGPARRRLAARGARRALEARVAASPALQAALERQRVGISALRGLELEAPAGLRRHVEAERSAPSRRVRGSRFAIGGALVGAAAAAALVAVLVLPSGAGGPTVVEAARLSRD